MAEWLLDWLRRFGRLPYWLYVAGDEGRGPTVVMLHGIASSSDNWHHLVPLLSQHYRCITIDLLGFGRSPKPASSAYRIEDHVRSLHATLRRLQLRGPVILVGHSLGSLIATRYAARYPRRVARLVLVSPPVYLHPSQVAEPRSKAVTMAYLAAYRYVRSHKHMTLTAVKRLAQLLRVNSAIDLTEESWLPFARSLEHCIESQTLIADLARVRVPADVFYGRLDQLLIPENLALIGELRGVRLHPVAAADHVVRKRLAKAIAEYLVEAR